jgi:hypothetical protein
MKWDEDMLMMSDNGYRYPAMRHFLSIDCFLRCN